MVHAPGTVAWLARGLVSLRRDRRGARRVDTQIDGHQRRDEVSTVDEDRRVGIVPVRVLQRIDDEAFVTGALQDGQLVVTGGIQFVTEGMVVRTGADTAG